MKLSELFIYNFSCWRPTSKTSRLTVCFMIFVLASGYLALHFMTVCDSLCNSSFLSLKQMSLFLHCFSHGAYVLQINVPSKLFALERWFLLFVFLLLRWSTIDVHRKYLHLLMVYVCVCVCVCVGGGGGGGEVGDFRYMCVWLWLLYIYLSVMRLFVCLCCIVSFK